MKKLSIIIFAIVGFTSCKKSKIDPVIEITVPAPEIARNYKVSGTIIPAGSVETVEILGLINGMFQKIGTTPDDQGHFSFDNLVKGDYSIILNTTSGFIAPAYQKISIDNSGDKDLGRLALQASRPLGTANIAGKIYPANAAYSVTLTGTKSTVIAVVNPVTGVFKAILLPEDTYKASFQTGIKYLSPDVPTVVTKDGKASDLGTLTFSDNAIVSTLSAMVASNAVRFETYANSNANFGRISIVEKDGSISINGLRTTGAMGTAQGGTSIRLGIKLDKFTGPGTYACNSSTDSKITYYYNNTQFLMMALTDCSTDIEDGNGSVVVTAYDPVKKTISGTYSGTLKGKSRQVYYDLVISKGKFDIRY